MQLIPEKNDNLLLYKAYKEKLKKAARPKKELVLVFLMIGSNSVFWDTIRDIINLLSAENDTAVYYPSELDEFQCLPMEGLEKNKKKYDINIVITDSYMEAAHKLALVNIVLAAGTDMYLRRIAGLAEKINARKERKKWKFIFSLVPQNKQKGIRQMMEDFQTCFAPMSEGEIKCLVGKKVYSGLLYSR